MNEGRYRAGLEELHIGAADANVVDFDYQLVFLGLGNGLFNDSCVFFSIQCDCFHFGFDSFQNASFYSGLEDWMNSAYFFFRAFASEVCMAARALPSFF